MRRLPQIVATKVRRPWSMLCAFYQRRGFRFGAPHPARSRTPVSARSPRFPYGLVRNSVPLRDELEKRLGGRAVVSGAFESGGSAHWRAAGRRAAHDADTLRPLGGLCSTAWMPALIIRRPRRPSGCRDGGPCVARSDARRDGQPRPGGRVGVAGMRAGEAGARGRSAGARGRVGCGGGGVGVATGWRRSEGPVKAILHVIVFLYTWTKSFTPI